MSNDSPVSVLYNADGEEIEVFSSGGKLFLPVHSTDLVDLLTDIKTELKIMNFHLSKITEDDIVKEDVDGE